MGGYEFASETELRRAVSEWCDDRTTAEAQYGQMSTWDVRRVSNFNGVFGFSNLGKKPNRRCEGFNEDLSAWDMSGAISLTGMFQGAGEFNSPIGNWDTSRVVDFQSIFDAATSFNQPIETWDVSRSTTFYSTFRLAESFNQPLDNWDVSKVTITRSMFQSAKKFNQPLDSWDTSRVNTMRNMFAFCHDFDQDLHFNVSEVISFDNMFGGHSLAMDNCHKRAIYDTFMLRNPLFACNNAAENAADPGSHPCGYSGRCCGEYDTWANYAPCPPSPPSPPPRPALPPPPPPPPVGPPPSAPDFWKHNSALVLGPAIGVVGALLLAFAGCLLFRWRKKCLKKSAAARVAALQEIASEYDASVFFAIQSLPTRKWAPGGTAADASSSGGGGDGVELQGQRYDEPECIICMTPFERGEEVRDLPCGHYFKKACIDEWLNNKGRPKQPASGQIVRGLASCPLCKTVPIEVTPPKEADLKARISRTRHQVPGHSPSNPSVMPTAAPVAA